MMRRLNILLRGVQTWQEKLPADSRKAVETVQAFWPALQERLLGVELVIPPETAKGGWLGKLFG